MTKKRIKLFIHETITGPGYYFFREYKILENEWPEAELFIGVMFILYISSFRNKVTVNYNKHSPNRYIYDASKVYGVDTTLKGWSDD